MSLDQEDLGLTIAEAARRLSVSENAVRQRIKRGSVMASKVDGVWRIPLVDLGDQEPDHQTTMRSDQETDQEVGRHADQEATTRRALVSPAAQSQLEAIRDEWLRPLVADVERLSRDVGRLEAERDAALTEVDRLRAAAVGPQVAGSDLPPAMAGTPWWRFWERR